RQRAFAELAAGGGRLDASSMHGVSSGFLYATRPPRGQDDSMLPETIARSSRTVQLTETQRQMRQLARKLAQKEIAPYAAHEIAGGGSRRRRCSASARARCSA